MKVFEDLIEELREENLLESTVIDVGNAGERTKTNGSAASLDPIPDAADAIRATVGESKITEDQSDPTASDEEENESDFYRKRAVDEISSLQMVEHVMSGIEREQMKIVPETYDDLQAKKALHNFLQVHADATTTEYAEAEFHLMRETEAWNTALFARDKGISVASLRRFCENSRPVLSSQALLSLARFYRNSTFSELTRAKFDFIMTRLFSRETDGEKRKLLFGRAEMIGHIKTLYANWSSLALYSADDVPLKSRAIVAGFEDRIAEAESALTFDQLIQNDFFRKIHEFKESTGEIFFTPEVVAATIDCNTKVGNKFVDLIRLERERTDLESVEQKYGYEYDSVLSEAAGKTLEVSEVLKHVPEEDDAAEGDDSVASGHSERVEGAADGRSAIEDSGPRFTFELFGVNKWLLAVTILVALSSGALYYWSSQPSPESSAAGSASDVSLESSELKEYVHSGRATSETFYAITLPAWDQLDEKKKREVLQRALEFANNNGQTYVQFVNVRGRNVGYASKTRMEVLNP